MNAPTAQRANITRIVASPARKRLAIALLGTGHVGSALLHLLDTPAADRLHLVAVANSQRQRTATLPGQPLAGDLAYGGEERDDARLLAALDTHDGERVIIDATASTDVAARHAHWLRSGYHVVTANKAAAAASQAHWLALNDARRVAGTRYGDSATVGAGLPILSTVRRLVECGDRVVTIEGTFSGSLSWLFGRYDGSRPFSALLREACAHGLTEPDPRLDLAGTDAARKLLILARSAGYALEPEQIEVENLVPPSLRGLPLADFLAAPGALDQALADHLAAARTGGLVLRHVASFRAPRHASVSLRALPPSHPLAQANDSDALFVLRSNRYGDRPLRIQGVGAGALVTAQALLAELLALAP